VTWGLGDSEMVGEVVLGLRRSSGEGFEGEVGGGGGVLLAPLVEEAAVAHRDVILGADAELKCCAVNPFCGAFELSVVADGGFVDDAVAFAVAPLGAPFFVAECGDKSKREKDIGEGVAVCDFSFGFDAVFVAILARAVIWKALVGDGPAAGIAADAEDLSAGAHLAGGGVVEDVAFKAARGMQFESSSLEALGEAGKVVDFEFDFGLDGHRQREYTAGGRC
jgi:hypothetical protein